VWIRKFIELRVRFMRRIAVSLLSVMASVACGCATTGSPPVGPAVLTADVRPFVVDALEVRYTGYLSHFNVAAKTGCYLTWAINPAGPFTAAEVDVRGIKIDPQPWVDRKVTVSGKLITRGPEHLPLIVAEQITPVDATYLANANSPR
jgi:hypothetical protein